MREISIEKSELLPKSSPPTHANPLIIIKIIVSIIAYLFNSSILTSAQPGASDALYWDNVTEAGLFDYSLQLQRPNNNF